MKIYLYLIIIIVITSCDNSNNPYTFYYKGENFLKNTKEFERENKLLLYSYGINCNTTKETPRWDKIHYFDVTFNCIDNFNLDQAREKLLKCIDRYLHLINSNESLKPFLYKYPFTYKELFFSIFFLDQKERYVDEKFITWCYSKEGTIRYFISTNNENTIRMVYEETYEEALKKIKKNYLQTTR